MDIFCYLVRVRERSGLIQKMSTFLSANLTTDGTADADPRLRRDSPALCTPTSTSTISDGNSTANNKCSSSFFKKKRKTFVPPWALTQPAITVCSQQNLFDVAVKLYTNVILSETGLLSKWDISAWKQQSALFSVADCQTTMCHSSIHIKHPGQVQPQSRGFKLKNK